MTWILSLLAVSAALIIAVMTVGFHKEVQNIKARREEARLLRIPEVQRLCRILESADGPDPMIDIVMQLDDMELSVEEWRELAGASAGKPQTHALIQERLVRASVGLLG
jgi:hypothetical protein